MNKCGDIDSECIVPITYLNSIGLKTKYCCSSHPGDAFGYKYYIMFDDSVTDEMMISFFNKIWARIPTRALKGKFSKWYRNLGERGMCSNWIYEVFSDDYDLTINSARIDFNFIILEHEFTCVSAKTYTHTPNSLKENDYGEKNIARTIKTN